VSVVIMIFLLVCGAVLQAIVPTGPAMGQVRLPVLLGLVIYYSLLKPRKTALNAALLAGLLQDALSMIPLGFSSFCFILTAWIINSWREEVFTRHWLTHMLLGLAAVPANLLVMFVLLTQARVLVLPWSGLLLKLWGSIVTGAIFVPLVCRAAETLEVKLGMLEARES